MISISRERALGLLELCGSFGVFKLKSGSVRPRFIIKMVPENRLLFETLRAHMRVSPPVHEYFSGGRHYLILAISSAYELKTKIVPLLKGNLLGANAEKLAEWLKKFRYLESKKSA